MFHNHEKLSKHIVQMTFLHAYYRKYPLLICVVLAQLLFTFSAQVVCSVKSGTNTAVAKYWAYNNIISRQTHVTLDISIELDLALLYFSFRPPFFRFSGITRFLVKGMAFIWFAFHYERTELSRSLLESLLSASASKMNDHLFVILCLS